MLIDTYPPSPFNSFILLRHGEPALPGKGSLKPYQMDLIGPKLLSS